MRGGLGGIWSVGEVLENEGRLGGCWLGSSERNIGQRNGDLEEGRERGREGGSEERERFM